MSLIPKTTAEKLANEIDSINTEVISFLKAMMSNAYAKANTAGQQQAVMDAFGSNAAQALGVYAVIYQTLESLGHAEDLTAPNFEVFSPNQDGSVTYTAPPEPEPSE
jgi:hypothetical protein